MKVTYDLQIEGSIGRRVRNPAIKEMIKFMNSDHKNACIEFDTVEETRMHASSARVHAKRYKLGVVVHLRENKIYFIKKE